MKPWTETELKEIARLRKANHPTSYIIGQMKVVRRSNVIPPVIQRSEPMATKKKAKKKVTKKKVPARKQVKKPGRKKGTFTAGEKITAIKGQDDFFYQKFPRYKAYQLLCKKGSMATGDFVNAVEKLEGVKNRNQALGIMTKLLEKGCAKATGAKKAA